MVKYFSRDLAEFKKDALTDDDETYLLHRKRHPNLSYSGSFVRSKGEKYLLDLLVWCGFTDIEYEPPIVIPDQNEYYLKKADAVCRFPGVQLPIYIEHWGMDEQS